MLAKWNPPVAVAGILLTLFGSRALAQTTTQPAFNITPITIKLPEASAGELMAQFSKTTGVLISVNPEDLLEQEEFQTPHALVLDKQAFWPAVKTLSETVGAYPQNGPGFRYSGSHPQLLFKKGPNPWEKRPCCLVDNFMVVAESLKQTRALDLINKNAIDPGKLTMQMTLYSDPRVRIAKLNAEVKIDDAKDETGQLLHNPHSQNFNQIQDPSHGGQFIFPLTATFLRPAHPGKMLATFKGTVELTVYSKVERWEVKDVLNASNVKAKEFTLKSAKFSPNGTVVVEISYASPFGNSDDSPFEGNRGHFMIGEVDRRNVSAKLSACQLFAEDGSPYLMEGVGVPEKSAAGSGVTTYRILFTDLHKPGEAPSPPTTFVLDFYKETKDLKLPVSFTNLPLP